MLIESGVLAGLGCVTGILLTFVGIPIFRAMAGDFMFAQPITLEGRVLVLTLGIPILTAVLFGLLPAWQRREQTRVERCAKENEEISEKHTVWYGSRSRSRRLL